MKKLLYDFPGIAGVNDASLSLHRGNEGDGPSSEVGVQLRFPAGGWKELEFYHYQCTSPIQM